MDQPEVNLIIPSTQEELRGLGVNFPSCNITVTELYTHKQLLKPTSHEVNSGSHSYGEVRVWKRRWYTGYFLFAFYNRLRGCLCKKDKNGKVMIRASFIYCLNKVGSKQLFSHRGQRSWGSGRILLIAKPQLSSIRRLQKPRENN